MRRTGRFFRNMWYLSAPYFRSEEKWSAWGLLLLVLAINFVIVRINVLLNLNGGAWVNAMQQYDKPAFLRLMLTYEYSDEGPFGIIPGFVPLLVVYLAIWANGRYLHQWLQIRWRRWMTARFQQQWLAKRAYYQIQLQAETLGNDNPDQRISEDINSFIDSGLSIGLGFFANIVSLVSFLQVLWMLSFPITLLGFNIPAYLVWVALLYSLVASVLAHLIGRPLISLNFIRQRLEADFRFALVRLRENAEGVALYRGEADESRILSGRFSQIVANWRRIMSRNRFVNAFTSLVGQVGGIFPFFAAAPLYFTKKISFGTLSRVAGAFGEVQGAASWLVDNYMALADWAATLDRLATFQRSMDALQAVPETIVAVPPTSPDLVVHDLQLALPNGQGLLNVAGLRVPAGVSTVITGRSGMGKSTLFRALAGIWPFGRGRIEYPAGSVMFLPQKPYIPLGTLRRAVSYPAEPSSFAPGVVEAALEDGGLGALVPELDLDMAWAGRLSLGEQQRLALVRALLIRPDWLFLDEATASLDPEGEAALYQLLRERLPNTTVVAIAHRPELAAAHDNHLVLDREGGRPSLHQAFAPSARPGVPAE